MLLISSLVEDTSYIATQVRIDLYHKMFLFILLIHQMECNIVVIFKRNHYIAKKKTQYYLKYINNLFKN